MDNIVFKYQDYLNDKLDNLKLKIERKRYSNHRSLRYIKDYEFESILSSEEISILQDRFFEMASEYLISNHKGKFVVYKDWCINICTNEMYSETLSDIKKENIKLC